MPTEFVEAVHFTNEVQALRNKGWFLVIGGDAMGEWVLLRNDKTDHIVGSLKEAQSFVSGWEAAMREGAQ